MALPRYPRLCLVDTGMLVVTLVHQSLLGVVKPCMRRADAGKELGAQHIPLMPVLQCKVIRQEPI